MPRTEQNAELRTIVLLFLTMFVSGTETLIVNPVLPQLASALSIEVDRAARVVTVYALSAGFFAFLFGPISDRADRKHVLVLGLLVLGLGTVLCGKAANLNGLLIARSIAGAGSGMLVTSTTSYVADRFSAKQRGVVIGYVMNGFFLAMLLGVFFGAAAANAFGWARMFQLLGGAILALCGLSIVVLPAIRTREKSDTNADHEEKNSQDWSTLVSQTFDIPATYATKAFSDYTALIRIRHVWGLIHTSALNMLSMTMYSVYLSPWMKEQYGFDTLQRGLVYAVGAPAAIIAAPLAGKLGPHFGRLPVIVAGNLSVLAVILAVSSAPSIGHWIETFFFPDSTFVTASPLFALFFILQSASAARSSAIETMAVEAVEPGLRGSMAAFRNFFLQLGSGIGASLGGLIWMTSNHNFFAICCTAAVLTAVSTGLVIMLSSAAPGAKRCR
jgi:predicted MFS family arabinose efflux permease